MRTLSLIICIIFTFLSCEDKRAFDLDSHEKQIVLNSIISTDSTWDVNLSYTKSIFDKNDHELIGNAEVRVINLTNGQSFFLSEKSQGNYCRALNPSEGHEYELNIKVEDRPLVRATTYVPSVLEVDVISQAVIDEEGTPSIEIDIEISDNPDEENYYVWELIPFKSSLDDLEDSTQDDPSNEQIQISAVQTLSYLDNNSTVSKPRNEISANDTYELITQDEEIGNNNAELKTRSLNSPSFISDKETKEGKIYNRLILNDKLLDNLNFSKIIESNQDVIDTDLENKKPVFQLSVRAVSGELYQYLQTYENYKQSNLTNTSIITPSEIYSNIENGSGIFGGYNLKTFNIY